jgi:predicted PurR-regulated permease PerM
VCSSDLPKDHAGAIREQLREIDRTLAGFVRGQSSVCLILGVFYAIGLTVAGLNFGLIIGMLAGVLTFIPFVGSAVGLVASVGMALAQFDDWVRIVIVAAIFVVGQVLEGNFLTPKLVGERVGLHPVWVIFALLAGGYLFGFVGVLLAVPVAAVIGVLTRFMLGRYLASVFHLGNATPDEVAPGSDDG